MAMYDWNHNGENDMQDDYLEYMIYKDCTNDNNSNTNHSSYSSGSSFGINVFVVIAGRCSKYRSSDKEAGAESGV